MDRSLNPISSQNADFAFNSTSLLDGTMPDLLDSTIPNCQTHDLTKSRAELQEFICNEQVVTLIEEILDNVESTNHPGAPINLPQNFNNTHEMSAEDSFTKIVEDLEKKEKEFQSYEQKIFNLQEENKLILEKLRISYLRAVKMQEIINKTQLSYEALKEEQSKKITDLVKANQKLCGSINKLVEQVKTENQFKESVKSDIVKKILLTIREKINNNILELQSSSS